MFPGTKNSGLSQFVATRTDRDMPLPSLDPRPDRELNVSVFHRLLSDFHERSLDHEVFQQKSIVLRRQKSTAMDANDRFVIPSIGFCIWHSHELV
jgi:hypothetical protein